MIKLNNNILYIHPAIRTYRVGIFELLAQKMGVEFFWSAKVNTNSYISKEINNILKNTNIKYIQANEIKKISIDNFSWQLLKLPFMEYNVYIFSGITSVPYLLLAPILKLMGKKIILFDELWRYPHEIPKYKKIYPYVKFLSRNCLHSVVVSGSKTKEFYIQEFKYDAKKIFIAYNTTIDCKKNVQDSNLDKKISNKLYQVTSKKKILFLARIIEIKGIDTLIKSMQKISNEYDLIIVGDGDFLDKCKVLVKELNLEKRVHFLNSCLSFESAYYYKNCDIFVLTSKIILNQNVQLESWGFTINEAMSLETPVVATNAVGSAYDLIIDGVTGAMAKESDINNLADKINFIIKNNENNIIGKNARSHLLNICNYKENYVAYKNAIFKALND